jgi:hypothetical protein
MSQSPMPQPLRVVLRGKIVENGEWPKSETNQPTPYVLIQTVTNDLVYVHPDAIVKDAK